MSRPRVSIGLPVYNGASLVREAIDSLLAQTLTDFELIICDNASTDATPAICAEYAQRDRRIRFYRNARNLGATRNFNLAFELSRGPYFKWMAHDDVVLPTMLEKCVGVLDAHPEVVLSFPRRRYMEFNGRLRTEDPVEEYHDITLPQLLRVVGSRFPAFMMGVQRREALARTRMLLPFIAAEEVWMIEMLLQGRIWQVPEELHHQRLPDDSDHRRARKTVRGEAIFLDPNNAKRRILVPPGLRLLYEKFNAIWRAPVSASQKGRALLHLLGHTLEKARRTLGPLAMVRYFRQNVTWATEDLTAVQREQAIGHSPRVGGPTNA